jgi:hypothetical protein
MSGIVWQRLGWKDWNGIGGAGCVNHPFQCGLADLDAEAEARMGDGGHGKTSRIAQVSLNNTDT